MPIEKRATFEICYEYATVENIVRNHLELASCASYKRNM